MIVLRKIDYGIALDMNHSSRPCIICEGKATEWGWVDMNFEFPLSLRDKVFTVVPKRKIAMDHWTCIGVEGTQEDYEEILRALRDFGIRIAQPVGALRGVISILKNTSGVVKVSYGRLDFDISLILPQPFQRAMTGDVCEDYLSMSDEDLELTVRLLKESGAQIVKEVGRACIIR